MARPIDIRLLSIGALPAVLPLLLILNYAVDVPFTDQWHPSIAQVLIDAHRGTLSVADIVSQQNEHRIPIPKLVYVALAGLTHWNVIVEMLAGWVVACATSIGVLWLIHRTQPCRTCVLWLLSNLLIFSPTQTENWLWGLGLTNFMAAAFFIAAMIVAQSGLRLWVKLSLVILFCSAATFSFGTGLLSWVLLAFFLGLSIETRKSKIHALVALSCGFLVNLTLYFIGYASTNHAGGQPYASGLGQALHFAIVFLGNSFAYGTGINPPAWAVVTGTFMLLLFAGAAAYFVFQMRTAENAPLRQAMLVWITIGGYAILSALMVAISRAGFGSRQAILSRYTTLSIYLPIALIQLLPMIGEDLRHRFASAARVWPYALKGLLVAMLSLQLLSLPVVLKTCRTMRFNRMQGKAALLLSHILPGNPLIETQLDPEAEQVVREAAQLDQIGYIQPRLIASNQAARIALPGMHPGGIERSVQSGPRLISLTGWAVLPGKARAADEIFLTYDDPSGQPIIFSAANTLGLPRADLPNAKDDPVHARSGWSAIISLDELPQQMRVVIISAWALDSETGQGFRLEKFLKVYP